MTSPLKRALMPSGSCLLEDDRLTVEARQVASGGIVAGCGARIQTVIERMRGRGQISARQSDAAERLYRAWSLGVAGARMDTKGCSAYQAPGSFTEAQLESLRLYRGARNAIGGARWSLLFAVVVEDWTIQRYANERGRDRNGSAEVLRTCLDDLADYFRLPKGVD
jgi:hypothetical protein